jgi:alpha/beta superfamily hydrolase
VRVGEATAPVETPAFIARGGEQLYTVHHRAAGDARAGAIVLAGPMGLERTHAYLAWVRWARALAAAGFDVVRFDYRGVGESTGDFAAMTFDAWADDLRCAIDHAARACGASSIAVHGFRFGALLASRAFAREEAASLLMWDPPASGRALLSDVLRRKLAADYAEHAGAKRVTRESYVADLEAGRIVEVEGYPWSRALWESADRFAFELPPPDDRRRWLLVHLDARPADRFTAPAPHGASVRVPRPHFWMDSNVLKPNLSALFDASIAWLREARAESAGRQRVRGEAQA